MASFIELAGNLRIRVVAEGIGTQEQLCFFVQRRLRHGAGFDLFPLSLQDFSAWRCRQEEALYGQNKKAVVLTAFYPPDYSVHASIPASFTGTQSSCR